MNGISSISDTYFMRILFLLNFSSRTAIPMIMGSNIGTSVTNTIVSFTQVMLYFNSIMKHELYLKGAQA